MLVASSKAAAALDLQLARLRRKVYDLLQFTILKLNSTTAATICRRFAFWSGTILPASFALG